MPRSNVVDLESATLAEARRLLDEADELELRVVALRAEAATRVRQAAWLTSEREGAASVEGPGRYEGEMRVHNGTILPCGGFKFRGG
jgi:hypothetical protein